MAVKELYDVDWLIRRYVSLEPESFTWESPWSHGSIQWSQRILTIAAYCLDHWPGGIAEIGCHTGTTTRDLAFLAQKRGRRVLAIDPWIPGTQNCEGGEHDVFIEMTKDVADTIDVLIMKSQTQTAVRTLEHTPLCFVLVDGSHEYADCLSDIKAVEHCQGVIAVDDILWNAAPRQAFEEAATWAGAKMVTHKMIKEGYLVWSLSS